jgi:hypothetical protein
LPDKENEWSKEGTHAHSVLEAIMLHLLQYPNAGPVYVDGAPHAMLNYARAAADFILALGKRLKAEVIVETRIYLPFVHQQAFGTFDGGVIEHFGTLHVFDFKYGVSLVRPEKNLQLIFYALGLAHKYHWNFTKVRLWIIQPRVRGYDGPTFWEISIDELRAYIPLFKAAVDRVENNPTFKEGPHCHWCKAKKTIRCPLTYEDRAQKAVEIFKTIPLKESKNGKEKRYWTKPKSEQTEIKTRQKSAREKSESPKSEADWKKKNKTTRSRYSFGRRKRKSPSDVFGRVPHVDRDFGGDS